MLNSSSIELPGSELVWLNSSSAPWTCSAFSKCCLFHCSRRNQTETNWRKINIHLKVPMDNPYTLWRELKNHNWLLQNVFDMTNKQNSIGLCLFKSKWNQSRTGTYIYIYTYIIYIHICICLIFLLLWRHSFKYLLIFPRDVSLYIPAPLELLL